MNFLKNLTIGGKIVSVLLIIGLIVGIKVGYEKFFPKKVKAAEVTTKATGLPPLAYDKTSNAKFRELPQLDEAVDVAAPEVRGLPFGWNGFLPALYATGGRQTSKGSICEELGVNLRLSVNNSTSEQLNQLYAFAEDLHNGTTHPSKGVHFIILMADAWANYAAGLNSRLVKDFGPEYRAEIVTFTGASFGEDKWMLKPKYAKDARGSLTATVIRDGDWNICVTKSQIMGWPVNHELGTYDRTKVNFVAAPNDDYTEAGKMYITEQKVTLKIVENGKYTGKDTTMRVSGVSSWFPVDAQLAEKGGLVTAASTADFASQMACGIIMIKKWADDNAEYVSKMIEAFGRAGDQIKSHDAALKFASQVAELVFADKEKDAEAWYNAYKTYQVSDEDGNEVTVGGTRAFNLADAARYTGVDGSTDTYKKIYNTFGNISKEAYPEVLSSFPDYTDAVDWKFLKMAYARAKQSGTAGNASKTDFNTADKGNVVGDASYAIEFGLNSAEIRPESYKILDQIANNLTVASETFVEIGGHTDITGDADRNRTLSEARAKAVRDYFERDSDLKGRIRSQGYGSSKLLPEVAPNDPRNRRVEIKLYKAK